MKCLGGCAGLYLFNFSIFVLDEVYFIFEWGFRPSTMQHPIWVLKWVSTLHVTHLIINT